MGVRGESMFKSSIIAHGPLTIIFSSAIFYMVMLTSFLLTVKSIMGADHYENVVDLWNFL